MWHINITKHDQRSVLREYTSGAKTFFNRSVLKTRNNVLPYTHKILVPFFIVYAICIHFVYVQKNKACLL